MIYTVFLKLFLALVLGGLIGFEREHMCRPAGLRTHVLVCVGASLVQITSLDFYAGHPGIFNTDPMRLGAQVISGIGFLGAGTILKAGTSIKGLTTAASIWTVACIGLAAGSGLYMEAIVATIFIYAALKGLKIVENNISKSNKVTILQVLVDDSPGMVGKIGNVFGELHLNIINVDIQNNGSEGALIEFTLRYSDEIPYTQMMDKLSLLKGIRNAKFI